MKGEPDDKESKIPWPESTRCKTCRKEFLIFPWDTKHKGKLLCTTCYNQRKMREKRGTLSITVAGIIIVYGILNFPTHLHSAILSRNLILWDEIIAYTGWHPWMFFLDYVLLGIDLIIIVAGFILLKEAHKEWNILRSKNTANGYMA